MYGALWRMLPGPVWLRVVQLVILFLAVLAVLIEWVFPWLGTFINVNEATVGP